MPNVSTFTSTGLHFYFQSARAKIDGKAVSQLVKFIQGAKHSLDVAIYDVRNADVLKALKSMSTKVQLHILYDAGKAAAAYSKTFGDLGSPGHSASHTPAVTGTPIKVKIGNIPVTVFFST